MRLVTLLSGGIDSFVATVDVLDHAPYDPAGDELWCVNILYGQAQEEVDAVRQVEIELRVHCNYIHHVPILIRSLDTREHKFNAPGKEMSPESYIVANRNMILLSIAANVAISVESNEIVIGTSLDDDPDFPDCRDPFIRAFESTLQIASDQFIRIHNPLKQMKKDEIIQKGIELGLNLDITFSCYTPTKDGFACGKCHSCVERDRGFAQVTKKS